MLLDMRLLRRALLGLVIVVVGLVAVAGAYTEITRIPDQP
jgi:hypothetical protein